MTSSPTQGFLAEQAKQAEEKHVAAQQRAAEEQTAALDRRIRVLDGLLTDSLAVLPLTPRDLKVTIQLPRFDPGALGTPRPEPDWADFEPINPRGLSWSFGRRAQYERQMTQAQGSFEFAKVQHRREEDQRQRALAAARARYEREVADAQAEVALQNAHIDACQEALERGDPEAVQWLVGHVLGNSWYPEDFPRRHVLAYQPEKRDLVVDFELPSQEVILKERRYRYAKESGVVEALPRSKNETNQHYFHIIACIGSASARSWSYSCCRGRGRGRPGAAASPTRGQRAQAVAAGSGRLCDLQRRPRQARKLVRRPGRTGPAGRRLCAGHAVAAAARVGHPARVRASRRAS